MLATRCKRALSALGTTFTECQTRFMASAAKELTVRDAINSAIDEEMARDDKVFVMGEEVGEYEGAYKVTRGLLAKYGGGRVRDTPITEHGFTGMAVGAAQGGMRPVLEFMTWNFAMQAMDQIVNSAAKTLYMSAGQINTPIVFRGPNGAAAGTAAQHSQCFAAWYSSVPGLKVVVPYDAEDHRGLTKAAIRDPDPVCILENELLYGMSFPITEEAMGTDFMLPIGKAKVGYCMDAAEKLKEAGISAEVINLRSLKPLDRDTVIASVSKTHRCVAVEEGWPHCGIASEVSASLMELAFDELDAPVERVTGVEVPMPYATNLELAALPSVDDIIAAARKVCNK